MSFGEPVWNVGTTNEIAVIVKCNVTYNTCAYKSMALEAAGEGIGLAIIYKAGVMGEGIGLAIIYKAGVM